MDRPDFGKQAAEFSQALKPAALGRLAVSLGLSPESLRRLGVGWGSTFCAFSFPMCNPAAQVTGIRLRTPDGRKWAVQGGKDGLFIPSDLTPGGQLLVAEGATDCAALLDLGFAAVGRPSCSGGIKLLVDLIRKLAPSEVVIVADSDAPGQRGAESLAVVLVAYCAALRVIIPPTGVKDAREWKKCGATAADVQAVVDVATVRRLAVRVVRKVGGRHGKR